jgi:hypothetical protein
VLNSPFETGHLQDYRPKINNETQGVSDIWGYWLPAYCVNRPFGSNEAEAVFRADLDRNPKNVRSLFGLSEALKAQQRFEEAEWVRPANSNRHEQRRTLRFAPKPSERACSTRNLKCTN